MPNEIIPYLEMCQREGVSLQRGMNFELRDNHSVILMSVRPNAPYADRLEDDGTTLIYEGHDTPRSSQNPNPKIIDQPEYTPLQVFQKVKLCIDTSAYDSHEKFANAVASFRHMTRNLVEAGVCNYNEFIAIAMKEEKIPAGFKIELRRQESQNTESCDNQQLAS